MAINLQKAGHQIFLSQHHDQAPAELTEAAPSAWPIRRKSPRKPSSSSSWAGHPAGRRRAVPCRWRGCRRRRRQGGDRHEFDLPTATKQFAEKIKATGAEYLDAPVSGGEVGAKAASLSIMVGGSEAAFERALPPVPGDGQEHHPCRRERRWPVAKVANQIIVALNIQAVAEALLFAARNGADLAKVREALMGGFAWLEDSRGTRRAHDQGHLRPGLPHQPAPEGPQPRPGRCPRAGLNLFNTANAQQVFSTCAAIGGSGWDHSALIRGLEHMANFSIRKE